VDDRKVGLIIRALRRRRGWRQIDLASRANVSQSLVSIIERGHVDGTSTRSLRQVLLALDAALWLDVRWRGGEVGRLLDEDHARLVGRVAAALQATGWAVRTEITYAEFSERGSFDVIAWHGGTRTLLVVEVKTELDSAEATFRKLDEKVRLAPKIARERFGWTARTASRLLDRQGVDSWTGADPRTRCALRRRSSRPSGRRKSLVARARRPARWALVVAPYHSP
jgi:transcriptional regulator with XRE-family HTH domain